MKKLKLGHLQAKTDILTREQLRNVFGGASASGSGSCQKLGEDCNTSQKKNCCSGLVCAEYRCYLGTY